MLPRWIVGFLRGALSITSYNGVLFYITAGHYQQKPALKAPTAPPVHLLIHATIQSPCSCRYRSGASGNVYIKHQNVEGNKLWSKWFWGMVWLLVPDGLIVFLGVLISLDLQTQTSWEFLPWMVPKQKTSAAAALQRDKGSDEDGQTRTSRCGYNYWTEMKWVAQKTVKSECARPSKAKDDEREGNRFLKNLEKIQASLFNFPYQSLQATNWNATNDKFYKGTGIH